MTAPLPVPLAPAVIVIQEMSDDVAVQAQNVGVVTDTDAPVAPAASTRLVAGLSDVEHDPCYVTMNGRPPIVSVTTRGAPTFGATANWTEPLVLPLAPDVIASHGAPPVAVHEQPLGVVTATVPVPPAIATVKLVGESSTMHAVPDCVTRARNPLIATSACRTDDAAFGDT